MLGLLPFQDVLIFSLMLSFVLALIYRLLTKPAEIRRIKEDMKFLREKVSKAQRSGNAEEAKKFSSDMMKASQEQFKASMKPMFASMILFFFFLGWLNAAYGGAVIDFKDSPTSIFSYEGSEHKILHEAIGNANKVSIDFNDDGTFSESETFFDGDMFQYGGGYWRVGNVDDQKKLTLEMMVAGAPFAFPFLGANLNWFWWYIIITLPSTMLFRKALGVE